jgi:hypothetical protein
MTNKTGIELVIAAAEEHGTRTDPWQESTDLKQAARRMWELMTPAQRLRLIADQDIREAVETNLPAVDYVAQFEELAEDQKMRMEINGPNGVDFESKLLSEFPAFLTTDGVSGSDLVDWIATHIVHRAT